MEQKEWPARDTPQYEELLDFITTGGKFPELLGDGLDPQEIDRKISLLRAEHAHDVQERLQSVP